MRSSAVALRSSAGPSSPSPKICAVPFRLTPESAFNRMLIAGLLAAPSPSNLARAALIRFLGSFGATIAHEFGLDEDFKMKDMKAVLYPIWRVDCMLEGPVEILEKRKQTSAWIGISEGYVPGNPFAPLSYLSFAIPPLPAELSEYNPEEDLKQLGEGNEVVEVPFTVSPLGLLKRLRQVVGRTTWEGFRIDQSKWKDTLFAAYPIMFPLFIGQFEHKWKDDVRTYSVIMDAHDPNPKSCRTSFPPPPELIDRGRFNTNYFVNPAPLLPSTHLMVASPLTRPPTSDPPISKAVADKFMEWMSPAPESATSIKPSPMLWVQEEEGGVDWEDPRIQSWAAEERQENFKYINNNIELQNGLAALTGLKEFTSNLPKGSDPEGMVVFFSPGLPSATSKPMSEIRKKLEEDVNAKKKELEGSKPGWLKKWEKSQKPIGAKR
ncbi:hypothetical protein TREMEDRAFT_67961 [Tremella mesenterica DSM 1558]|uniref:uncharacterized protein n=1 Tax=Tremella mesenterica (strain ATCC 24925 / CBS 8224 / DSM 1558 / NBRC 9311 / NRRL Y-6157 / RJB 2259-6 / UBC 559-6) TaxID=578456 RepID=UPI0003F49CB6|nr:uncharacterized protein TREMEDRAFT_67961 [Tremella mesenterica DSM 1558]EIW71792.1 hypothetical protein TREMEDRAFT_67961 [Tremella mesenterica DSM 1558]